MRTHWKSNRAEPAGPGYASFVPAEVRSNRLLVLVHGRTGSASAMVHRFRELAIEQGIALLAPDFTDRRYRGFQLLRGADGPFAAAEALQVLASREAERLGLDASPFDLLGYSAGAQFAHRFAMFFPDRVARLFVVSAGWYCECTSDAPFPDGLGGAPAKPNLRGLLAIPKLLAVGELDVERDSNLRQGTALDSRQGPNRLERARRWATQVQALAAAEGTGANLRFELLRRTGHNLKDAIRHGGLCALVAKALAETVPGDLAELAVARARRH
jgi:pimeloyl-ACP methyl ester carboxylesterase